MVISRQHFSDKNTDSIRVNMTLKSDVLLFNFVSVLMFSVPFNSFSHVEAVMSFNKF